MTTQNADAVEKLDHSYIWQFIKKKLNMNHHKTQHLDFRAFISER